MRSWCVVAYLAVIVPVKHKPFPVGGNAAEYARQKLLSGLNFRRQEKLAMAV
ncbi:MAG TPA: hypothetical protein VLM40_16710 [Gemmata sp.]|nr:hypothetical protein [Gemmata sp.]